MRFVIMVGRRSTEPANISSIEKDEASGKSAAPDMEGAVNKLVKAEVALREATQVLSEIHLNLIILANKRRTNRGHVDLPLLARERR